MCHNVLVNSTLVLINVLLYRPQSRRLHILYDGWVHPAVIWLKQGLLACNSMGELVLEPPIYRSRWGITTHVSDPNRSTDWTTTFKNVPGLVMSTPSHTRICDSCTHLFLRFLRLYIITGKLLFMADRSLPRYLNDPNFTRGWP